MAPDNTDGSGIGTTGARPRLLTPHQSQYMAWLLTRRAAGDSVESLASTLVDAQVDLNPHQVEAVMIATEAGAEDINLQFCSLVINYHLPWNPQRIEQRIGRCHRYGQKHDVVVVNFVDRSNEADARVYELLVQKFQLFEGVFGASDEVLGAIGSGVDFERRSAEIYQNCREPAQIRASFEQLQLDPSGEINAAMVNTRQILLENFDEQVWDKLLVRAQDSHAARSRYERMLMELTQAELGNCATFDDHGFVLRRRPGATAIDPDAIPTGRYELSRRSGEAHLYRIGHPLAEWATRQAKSRDLPDRKRPSARLVFDYDAYGTQISTLKAYRGNSGWLSVTLVEVVALGNQEQHLLVAATTFDGAALAEDDPEKLLRLPAAMLPSPAGGKRGWGRGRIATHACRRHPSPQTRPAARHQPAQPRLLRAGSPEAGRLGRRPEAWSGATDQGHRPRDQGGAPQRCDLADAGRKTVVAEEAA
ncbi:MAG: helicase-related protein [Porticoccaceae bacterium]